MARCKLTWSYSLDFLLQPRLAHHLLHNDCPLLLHLQVFLEQLAAANLATEVQLLKPRAVLELPCTRQPRQLLHWLVKGVSPSNPVGVSPNLPKEALPSPPDETSSPSSSETSPLLSLLLSQEELCQLIQLKLHHPFLLRKVFPLLLLLPREVLVIQNHLLLQEVICPLLLGENHLLLQETPPSSSKSKSRSILTCINALHCSQVESAVRRYFAILEI